MDTTVEKAKQVIAQTQAQGLTPFAGSAYDQATATSKAITPESLSLVTPIKLPDSGIHPTFDINTINTTLPSVDNTPTATETQQKSLSDRLLSLMKSQDKTTATAEAEKAAGLPELNTQLTGINNQIQELQKQAAAATLTSENRLAPMTAIRGEQAQIERARSVKALGLSAIAQTLQGNIFLAQERVNKAVELQFAPQEAEIKYLQQALELNKDTLTREDKKKADQLQIQLAERTRILSNAKEDSKTGQALALAALKNFPNDKTAQYNAQLAIQEAQKTQPDLNKIMQLVGQYQTDPVATAKSLAELDKTRLEITKLNNEISNNGLSTTITNPDASKYAGALNVVIGSSKLTKEQKNDLIKSVNQGQDPATVLKNKAKDILGTDAKELTGYEVAKSELQNISSIMDEYYANGGSTGIFTGNTEKVLNKIGEVRDPKLVGIATRLSVAIMNYRRAVTGTAASVQEDTNITSVFPGINKSEGLNKAIIGARIQSFDTSIDNLYSNALGKEAYNAIKQSEIANTPQQNQSSAQVYTLKGINYAQGEDGKYYPEQSTSSTTKQTQENIPVKTTTNYKSMLPQGLDGTLGGFNFNSFFK